MSSTFEALASTQLASLCGFRPLFGSTPHPVIVAGLGFRGLGVVIMMDNRGHIGVLLYSSYTTLTGCGVLLTPNHTLGKCGGWVLGLFTSTNCCEGKPRSFIEA